MGISYIKPSFWRCIIKNPISPDAIGNLISYSNPKLSPDGRMLVLVKNWINQRSGEKISKIVFKMLLNGKFSTFIDGNKESGPKFSPDSRLLAFTRLDNKGKLQVWFSPISGAKSFQITSVY